MGALIVVGDETLHFVTILSAVSRCILVVLRSRGEEDLLFLLPKVNGPMASLIPHSQTIRRASSVTRSRSLPAPVVRLSHRDLFSDTAAEQNRDLIVGSRGSSCAFVGRQLLCEAGAMPRGMIVTLWIGSACGSRTVNSAGPAS